MKTGAPAFGTPEYAKAAQASGQLARRIGVPFRSSNTTAANAIDAQAAYESMMSLWGCLMGGAHLVIHGAGWMHGGLTASFEKLILDAEMLGMMQAYFAPIQVTEESLSLDAIVEAGVGGHFFGTAQTMAQYETAFHPPMLSNWDSYPNWLARGAEQAPPAPTGSGRTCWPPMNHRRWTTASTPRCRTSWPAARPKAVRRRTDRRPEFLKTPVRSLQRLRRDFFEEIAPGRMLHFTALQPKVRYR